MSDVPERTLTAQISPFGLGDSQTTPLLLLAGRAGTVQLPDADRILVSGSELIVGRRSAGGAAVAPGALMLDDSVASSRHARLWREGARHWVEDLGSKNGTFVDGRRIAEPVDLIDGTRVFIGGHVLVFRMAAAAEIDAIKAELQSPLGPVATTSPRLAVLCSKLRRLATSTAEILLVGETGVGKEIYARAVHRVSGRTGQFVALNCAAIPRELVESELFGYGTGAHSTAHKEKSGLLETADGGTLFLDEIGEMSPDVQTKLLRFLQDRLLMPLGSTRQRRIDVRVIAATNREISPGTRAAGTVSGLRDDLLGRLGAAPIRILPLRERVEDVGALANHFLNSVAAARARSGQDAPRGFDVAALRALVMMEFPMNVRELEKIVIAAAALARPGTEIGTADLPDGQWQTQAKPAEQLRAAIPLVPTPSGRQPPRPAPDSAMLEQLLTQHRGNVADVARTLGRQRAAVWRWIKRYGLLPEQYR